MLLDKGGRLNALHSQLTSFLESCATETSFPADVTHDPAPFEDFLPGLRVKKAEGKVVLRLADDRWLELAGSKENLAEYIRHFRFDDPDADVHHHPENGSHMSRGSMHLVVEADSSWGEHAG